MAYHMVGLPMTLGDWRVHAGSPARQWWNNSQRASTNLYKNIVL